MQPQIKNERQKYQENKDYKWYGEKCVVCKTEITDSPLSVNVYENVGVTGYECGSPNCKVKFGSEKYKQLYWTAHNLMVFMNPEYWGKNVAEKNWEELYNFVKFEFEPNCPSLQDKMEKYPLIDLVKTLERLKEFLR